MVSPLASSVPFGGPGIWDNKPITGSGSLESEFHFESTGILSNSGGTETLGIAPGFQHGEVWALRVRMSLSTEPTGGIVVLELMDSGATDFIQKAIVPEFGGNEAEINTILDWNAVDSVPAAPTLRVTNLSDDNTNAFVDAVGIRVRAPTNTDPLVPSNLDNESFD